MKYHDIVAYNLEHNLCPFCSMPEDFILEKSDSFYVTLARAPYIKDHLLIIPRRHVILFNDLSWDEVQDLMQLISKWNKKLHQKHHDVNLLLRDGFMWGAIGKSVNHMHFHLIPDMAIGPEKTKREERQFLSEKDFLKAIKNIKKALLAPKPT